MSTLAASNVTITSARGWQVELLLQIHVAIMVILGTSLLAMGQQNLIYALVAVVAAGLSIILTDMKRLFELGPNATTAVALLACLVLVVQVIRNEEQSHLLNVANILIYLEVILLFHRKEDRTYWSLMALSLLQVVVAAALNLGLLFGLLLGLYVLIAIVTMTLFCIVRETRPFVAPQRTVRSDGASAVGLSSFEPSQLTAEAAATILNRALLRRLLITLSKAIAVTVVVFFLIPRYGTSVWQVAKQEQLTTVGFTEEVQLDNISELLENPEQVMRVELKDMQGNPYHVDNEPFFRGAVLPHYEYKGFWKPGRRMQGPDALTRLNPAHRNDAVLQRIALQPGSHSVLFNIAACYRVSGTPTDMQLNRFTRQLTLKDDRRERRGVYEYDLATTAFRNGWQRDLIQAIPPVSQSELDRDMSPQDLAELRTRLPGLVAQAESVLAAQSLQVVAANSPGADPARRDMQSFDRCKALEGHFRNSGLYTYSLEVNRNRDRSRDPLDDFVARHRTGHCEYFAGALIMMLRSQGIPARMVVGYKGGEFNAVGNYYVVRQLHAHAWVEAYLSHDEIPAEERDTREPLDEGAWLQLDPTPSGGTVSLRAAEATLFTTVREFVDYCQVLWDDYVLGLDQARQQQLIYAPVVNFFQSLGRGLVDGELWRQRWNGLRQWFVHLVTGQLISWPWLLAGLGVGAVVIRTIYRARHRWWGAARRRLSRFAGRARSEVWRVPQLDVYARLERTLQRHGWRRSPHQTPQEFALQMRAQLSASEATVAVAGVPDQVTKAYYQVRYGAQILSDDQCRQLQQAVDRFAHSLTHGRER